MFFSADQTCLLLKSLELLFLPISVFSISFISELKIGNI